MYRGENESRWTQLCVPDTDATASALSVARARPHIDRTTRDVRRGLRRC